MVFIHYRKPQKGAADNVQRYWRTDPMRITYFDDKHEVGEFAMVGRFIFYKHLNNQTQTLTWRVRFEGTRRQYPLTKAIGSKEVFECKRLEWEALQWAKISLEKSLMSLENNDFDYTPVHDDLFFNFDDNTLELFVDALAIYQQPEEEVQWI